MAPPSTKPPFHGTSLSWNPFMAPPFLQNPLHGTPLHGTPLAWHPPSWHLLHDMAPFTAILSQNPPPSQSSLSWNPLSWLPPIHSTPFMAPLSQNPLHRTPSLHGTLFHGTPLDSTWRFEQKNRSELIYKEKLRTSHNLTNFRKGAKDDITNLISKFTMLT